VTWVVFTYLLRFGHLRDALRRSGSGSKPGIDY
jgi:hypothetical protein